MPFDETQGKPEDKRSTRSEREESVLKFWKDNKIFQKSLEKESPKGDFVFYEGPPTANGKPAIHHLEARAFKDAIPRYKTMQGFRVPRQAGWDTHGLPVEIEAEKTLGLKSKKEIEEYGVEKFNAECKRSVGKYIDEWSRFTDRIGYWVDFDEAYFTYDNLYIESVWSILAHVEKRGLLYKDYKIVPWCPRCGTTLSSHELAQGYRDVKDLSLYVKFRIISQQESRKSSGRFAQPGLSTFLLAWTTTPWTLPGNVALAVGEKIDYVKVEIDGSHYIVAKERQGVLRSNYPKINIIEQEIRGKDLIGLEYEPLYNFIENNGRTFKVYSADFVTTEEGTGIVHTAVMYGQDDFELGTKLGLPKAHLVSPEGTFIKGTDWLEGRSVTEESLSVDILKDLQKRGLLFDKENHTHSYPFCWRCSTRLIYYARDSWYIRMSELRSKLIEENQKINWEPEYIKEGRFGEWLREVKDWAISRERYWGTPLPVWTSEDGERIVVDSIETLRKFSKKRGNKYIGMRHGQSDHNVSYVCSATQDFPDHVTEQGREDILESAHLLRDKKITKIFASPFVRTRETAELVAQEIGYPVGQIIFDDRIREYGFGEFDQKPRSLYDEWRTHNNNAEAKPKGGESVFEAKKRVADFLYDIEQKYSNEVILFVSHGIVFEVLQSVINGYSSEETQKNWAVKVIKYAHFEEYNFVPLPHNADFELDLHKPFIDEVVLEKEGKEFRRVNEVVDVWFDSGSVPFAQNPQDIKYPADFISEGIDQTRGWFYTMHAIGVLLEKGLAFKNVICLGLIMDKEGKKMSKSVGNIVDPSKMIEKHGVDALRLWMYSVNQPGESKNFDEQTVEEINRKVFNLLDNVYAFYDLYAEKGRTLSIDAQGSTLGSENILDRWILIRLNELINTSTSLLDQYKLLEPVRSIREFIDDLSTWYLRRSRDRIKEGDEEAKRTLYFVLKSVSKLLAPFAPFYAEDLYQKLRIEGDPESVHLEMWPNAGEVDKQIIENIERTRELVSLSLEQRSKANIKIRQPLSELRIKNDELGIEYLNLIQEELNVKKVVQDKNLDTEIKLDTTLTPELLEEGRVREIIRSIQEMRKEKNLKPSDKLEVRSTELEVGDVELITKHKLEIERATNTTLLTS